MNNDRAQIILGGDVSPLQQKLREAAADMKRFGADGEAAIGRISGGAAALQKAFLAVGSILAGGAFFKAAVSAATDFHIEIDKLSKSMGISDQAAVALRFALGDIYVGADTAESAISKLVQTLNTAPEKFAALGVSVIDPVTGRTRDLLSIMLDTNDAILKFAEGADRSRAAAYIYGKEWMEVRKILDLTTQRLAEAAEKARALGIELKSDDVAQYRASMNDFGDVIEAVKIRIGTALLPSLRGLATYMSEIGGPVIDAVVWGFKHLVQFLDETATMFRLVWNDAKFVFDQLTTAAGQMGASLASILQGNISQAREVWAEGNRQILANEQRHLSEFARINSEHAERVKKLWSKAGAERGSAGGPGKPFGLSDPENKRRTPEKSDMPSYEAALAAMKNAYEQENALRQFGKEQELEYWRSIQNAANVTAKDRLEIAKRTATLETEIRREAARLLRAFDAQAVESRRSAALAQIALEEQQATFAHENGEITKNQLLALEESFARRRFEIEYQALLERMELAKNDPNSSPDALARMKEQMLEIERNYQLRRGEIGQAKRKEEGGLGGVFDDAGNAFGNMANALLTRATTLREQLAQVFQSIYQSFVQNLVTKPLGEWIAGQARMIAAKLGFAAQEKAVDMASAATKVAAKSTETGAIVAGNAAQAGSGAASSVAGIPIVGPVMALAAMATVFAAVMALSNRKSAARGYDIPKGLNPLTQLHEEEMVLPQKYADVMRRMADGGGPDSGSREPAVSNHFTIHTPDPSSFKRWLEKNYHTLPPALRSVRRSFAEGAR